VKQQRGINKFVRCSNTALKTCYEFSKETTVLDKKIRVSFLTLNDKHHKFWSTVIPSHDHSKSVMLRRRVIVAWWNLVPNRTFKLMIHLQLYSRILLLVHLGVQISYQQIYSTLHLCLTNLHSQGAQHCRVSLQ